MGGRRGPLLKALDEFMAEYERFEPARREPFLTRAIPQVFWVSYMGPSSDSNNDERNMEAPALTSSTDGELSSDRVVRRSSEPENANLDEGKGTESSARKRVYSRNDSNPVLNSSPPANQSEGLGKEKEKYQYTGVEDSHAVPMIVRGNQDEPLPVVERLTPSSSNTPTPKKKRRRFPNPFAQELSIGENVFMSRGMEPIRDWNTPSSSPHSLKRRKISTSPPTPTPSTRAAHEKKAEATSRNLFGATQDSAKSNQRLAVEEVLMKAPSMADMVTQAPALADTVRQAPALADPAVEEFLMRTPSTADTAVGEFLMRTSSTADTAVDTDFIDMSLFDPMLFLPFVERDQQEASNPW